MKRISNPAYKGTWEAKKIANPEFVDDDNLHLVKIQLEMLTIDHWPRKASKWVNVLVHSGSFQIRDVIKSQMLSSDIDKFELQQVDAEVFVCDSLSFASRTASTSSSTITCSRVFTIAHLFVLKMLCQLSKKLRYKYDDFGFIGFDLWQVKGNTIFDNVIITETWR